MLKKIFFVLLGFAILISEVAAEIKIESQISSSTFIIGDQVHLRLKIDGAKQGMSIKFPRIEGVVFQQLGAPMSSSQTIIVNGKVSSFSGLIYNIGVSAEKIGSYFITGINVKYKNKLYPVDDFRLRVIAASQESNMKIVLQVSDKEIYIHQPLEISVKWLLQENIENYNFRFPLLDQKDKLQLDSLELSNGSVRKLKVSGYEVAFQEYLEDIKDENYTVYLAKFKVYPFQTGVFKIPAASVKAAARRGEEVKRDFFGRLVRVPKLKNIFAVSEPIQVFVKSLPEQDRPQSFSGGVGEYKIEISADAGRVKVGDPLELSIRITGKGNFDKIERPLLSELSEYKNNFVIIESLQPGNIEGDSVIFKQIIRPNRHQIAIIPPVEFSYFNPELEQYETVQSNSLPLKVLPAQKVSAKDIVAHYEENNGLNSNLLKQQDGVHANYASQEILESQSESAVWPFWLLVPPMVYVICLALAKRRRILRGDKALLRAKSAKSHRDKRLKKARELMRSDDELFFAELARALNDYIADSFNLGAGELTGLDIRKMEEQGLISHDLAEKLVHCLNEFYQSRFTNSKMSTEGKENIFDMASNAIKDLEREL